jgi:hypothetical protein
MAESILYFKRPGSFDKWSIGVYLFLTIAVLYLISPSGELIFWYGLITQFCLYAFCYLSLRNMAVFLIWLAIGLFHFYMYMNLKQLNFEMEWENGATPLRHTAVLLILFQVLRFVSLGIQKNDLVMPSKIGATDLYDEREVTWVDVALFLIYLGGMVGLNFL